MRAQIGNWVKYLSLFAVTMLIAFVVGACAAPTTSQAPAAEEGATSASTSEMEPSSGGTLTFAIREEARGLDPVLGYRYFGETTTPLYDMLAISDQEGNTHPDLAKSWEISEDARHYTFQLRKDVVFHDGTPFNAEAVKSHFDRVHNPDFCCGNAYEYTSPYESSEVLDEYTVRVNFAEPWGPFGTSYLDNWDVSAIASPAAAEEMGKEFDRNPVGSGPFKFVEWVPQSHIIVERYPDYNWAPEIYDHQGPAYLDRIQIRFIEDPSTLVACLETGECDVIKDPQTTDLERLRDDPNFRVEKVPHKGSPFSFNFNTNKFPTNEVAVRKAINLAINRERINEAVFRGERTPLYTALTPTTPEYWPGAAEYIYHDPEEAKTVLEEAGWKDADGDGIREKDGQPLSIDIFVFGSREANPSIMTAEAMQSDLKAVGVNSEIKVRPWDDQSVVAMHEEHHLIMYDMPFENATVLGVLYHSRETPSEGHYGMGFTWFHEGAPDVSQQLDSILAEADSAFALEERKEIYAEAQKIIAENYLGVPIASGNYTYALSEHVHDVKYDNKGYALFYDAWLESE